MLISFAISLTVGDFYAPDHISHILQILMISRSKVLIVFKHSWLLISREVQSHLLTEAMLENVGDKLNSLPI